MPELPDLIREYCELLDQERYLDKRKADLKAMIEAAMHHEGVAASKSEFGSAQYQTRHTITPRREAVLDLLDRDDLLPFASFTAAKITEVLVPKYGRDRLIPLFDIKSSKILMIKRPSGPTE